MKTKLWTIQNERGWDELQVKGILIPKSEFIEPYFIKGYNWMKKQMTERIGKPRHKSQYPIWAWYQHFSINKRKPDLRLSGHLPPGTKGYRIEFEKDEKDILLSEFGLWHSVLYECYLPFDIKDYEAFEEKIEHIEHIDFEDYPQNIKTEIEKSWNKIFDMEFGSPEITLPFNEKKIQATLWELRLSDIKKVDEFIAK
ncbi:DUF3841 domain-containing protein [Flavobacteriaceae bacterium MHTCC 0001]